MSNNVAKFRKQKGISQSELARKVGVTRFHINKIESGKTNMSVPLASRIAKELGVTLNDIFFTK